MSKDFPVLAKYQSHLAYISSQLQLQGNWITEDSSVEERKGLWLMNLDSQPLSPWIAC